MKKIWLLLLMFVVPVFAMNEYDVLVNTPQEVGIYVALFDSIHFFFHGETGENYMSLLRFITLFGTIIVTVKAVQSMSASGGGNMGGSSHTSLMGLATYQMFVVMMLMTLFARESVLIVKHPQSLRFETTATIPDVFGFTIAFFSTLNYRMTEIAESAFSDLRGQSSGQIYDVASSGGNIAYGMSGLGYGGLPNGMKEMNFIRMDRMTAPDGKTATKMLRAYLSDCVIMPLSDGGTDYLGTLMQKDSFFLAIDPAAINAETGRNISTSIYAKYDGGYIACGELHTELKNRIRLITPNLSKSFGSEMAAVYYTNQMMANNMGTVASTSPLIKDAAFVQAQLVDTAMGSEYQSIFADLGASGSVFASGAASSLADIQQNGTGAGVMMAEFLPVFASFIFLVMIASFPFMFAFALMPGGFDIMIQFVKTLAWVSLWSPMAAVLNFFIDYRMVEAMLAQSGGSVIDTGMPLTTMIDLSSEAAMMAGLAGYLYLMVPGLSWMLITGSGVMLSSITNSLGQSFQKNANAGAVAETAKVHDAAAMSNGSTQEMLHYQHGADMAGRSAAYSAQKKVYGDDFGGQASDMSKQQTMQLSQQKGFGKQTTMGGAAAGGMLAGEMTGASTEAMGNNAGMVSDSDKKNFGSVSAAKQILTATGAGDQLKEHGGFDKMVSHGENTTRMGAIAETSSSDEFEKDVDGHRAGVRKQTAQKMGGIAQHGNNEYNEGDYRKAGENVEKKGAHDTMGVSNAIGKEENSDLKHAAYADASEKVTGKVAGAKELTKGEHDDKNVGTARIKAERESKNMGQYSDMSSKQIETQAEQESVQSSGEKGKSGAAVLEKKSRDHADAVDSSVENLHKNLAKADSPEEAYKAVTEYNKEMSVLGEEGVDEGKTISSWYNKSKEGRAVTATEELAEVATKRDGAEVVKEKAIKFAEKTEKDHSSFEADKKHRRSRGSAFKKKEAKELASGVAEEAVVKADVAQKTVEAMENRPQQILDESGPESGMGSTPESSKKQEENHAQTSENLDKTGASELFLKNQSSGGKSEIANLDMEKTAANTVFNGEADQHESNTKAEVSKRRGISSKDLGEATGVVKVSKPIGMVDGAKDGGVNMEETAINKSTADFSKEVSSQRFAEQVKDKLQDEFSRLSPADQENLEAMGIHDESVSATQFLANVAGSSEKVSLSINGGKEILTAGAGTLKYSSDNGQEFKTTIRNDVIEAGVNEVLHGRTQDRAKTMAGAYSLVTKVVGVVGPKKMAQKLIDRRGGE